MYVSSQTNERKKEQIANIRNQRRDITIDSIGIKIEI